MADNTALSAPVGTGQTVRTEDIGGGVQLPVSKVYVGPHGTDGGPVTVTNPFPVELSDGTQAIGVSAHPIRTDPVGTTTQPVAVAGYPASTYYTALAAVSGVAKASAGNLKSLKAANRNAAARYIQIFNSAAGPTGGATPLDQTLVPAGATVVLGTDFFTDAGVALGTGIAWGFSTTSGTYTAATAADHDFAAAVV